MAWRILLGPLWVAALAGGWVAAVAYGRREAWSQWPRWPFLVGGLALFLGALLTGRIGGEGGISAETLGRGVGLGVLVFAALLAFLGSRSRARATLLLAHAPLSLDEAVDRVRAGMPPPPGAFSGRIGAADQVASPGGVMCAVYEAELRQFSSHGVKGALLSLERASASLVYVRGERSRAKVAIAEGSLWAPVQVRRCWLNGRLSVAEDSALASGVPPMDAVSHEKVAKLGEPCVVVGRLARGLADGSYVIKGPHGGPAMIALGEEVTRSGRRLFARAWMLFVASAALSVLAAWLIAP